MCAEWALPSSQGREEVDDFLPIILPFVLHRNGVVRQQRQGQDYGIVRYLQ